MGKWYSEPVGIVKRVLLCNIYSIGGSSEHQLLPYNRDQRCNQVSISTFTAIFTDILLEVQIPTKCQTVPYKVSYFGSCKYHIWVSCKCDLVETVPAQ